MARASPSCAKYSSRNALSWAAHGGPGTPACRDRSPLEGVTQNQRVFCLHLHLQMRPDSQLL